jgi:hypothetical protein
MLIVKIEAVSNTAWLIISPQSVLDEKVPFGLIPHVQARLLARHLRGDIEEYTPFLYS